MIAPVLPPPPSDVLALAILNGAAGPCAEALAEVLATDRVTVPNHAQVICPATAAQTQGHRGLAWVATDRSSAWVAIHSSAASSRYVWAHELCHLGYGLARGDLTESTADACAKDLGFPRA